MTPTLWSTMIRQEHVSWSPSSSSSSCFQSVSSTAALNYILLEEVVEEVIMMKTEKPRDIIITDKTDKDKETGHHHPSIMKVSRINCFCQFCIVLKICQCCGVPDYWGWLLSSIPALTEFQSGFNIEIVCLPFQVSHLFHQRTLPE